MRTPVLNAGAPPCGLVLRGRLVPPLQLAVGKLGKKKRDRAPCALLSAPTVPARVPPERQLPPGPDPSGRRARLRAARQLLRPTGRRPLPICRCPLPGRLAGNGHLAGCTTNAQHTGRGGGWRTRREGSGRALSRVLAPSPHSCRQSLTPLGGRASCPFLPSRDLGNQQVPIYGRGSRAQSWAAPSWHSFHHERGPAEGPRLQGLGLH